MEQPKKDQDRTTRPPLVVRVVFLVTYSFLLLRRNIDSKRVLASLDLVWSDDVTSQQQFGNVTTIIGNSSLRQVVYSIRREDSYKLAFSARAYKCPIGNTTDNKGNSKWREPLLESLQRHLNFTAFIETDLKVLVVGDSVGIQIGQLLEEAMGVSASSRHVLHESWPGHEGLTISSTHGGGTVAHMRLTGMLLSSGEGKPIPNYGRGWNRTHVQQLMQHRYLTKSSFGNAQEVVSFDVMIFRISHGWLPFESITEETLRETIYMAKDLFGVTKIIIMNVPFNNNIKTQQSFKHWKATNEMVERVASSYPSKPIKIGQEETQVAVLQFAQWTNFLMHHNAQAIGWNTTDSAGAFNETYPLGRLGCRHQSISIAQGCSERVNEGDCSCKRNRISQDGMHWCFETLGGRLVAGLACLMACFQDPPQGSALDAGAFHNCEARCNNQFMSLQPLGF